MLYPRSYCGIASQSLFDQQSQLIFRLLGKLEGNSVQSSPVFVVDALDECEGENDIYVILQFFTEAQSLADIRLQVFVTSRLEIPIRQGFYAMPKIVHHNLVLYNVCCAIMDHDCHESKPNRLVPRYRTGAALQKFCILDLSAQRSLLLSSAYCSQSICAPFDITPARLVTLSASKGKLIYLLRKCLYSLKQAPRAWYKDIDVYLIGILSLTFS